MNTNNELAGTQHNVIYIHGFISSPNSLKAQQTKAYLAEHYPKVNFYCPQLPACPLQSITILETLIQGKPAQNWHLIGSSLGGYYATYLTEKFKLASVLVNPAVKPYELFVEYLGEQTNHYTQEIFTVDEHYMNQLKALDCNAISKKSYMVMVQTGDEVLNYQQAVSKYQDCQLIVQQGGDHSFIDFPKMLPSIINFWQLRQ